MTYAFDIIPAQTVIVDSCHSGSSTRSISESRQRGFDLPQDRAIDMSISDMEAASPNCGMTSDSSSHVLLAATSLYEPAIEKQGRGVFTRALLDVLRNHPRPDLLTYSEVIYSLPTLDQGCVSSESIFGALTVSARQEPQCEGNNAGRYLFKTIAPARGYRYRRQANQVTLEAGEIQGITEHTVFDLYETLSLDGPPLLRGLVAERPRPSQTVLRFPQTSAVGIPCTGWALPILPSKNLADIPMSLGSSQGTWQCLLDNDLGGFHEKHPGLVRCTLDGDEGGHHLSITKDVNDHIVFDLTSDIYRKAGVERLRHTIGPECDQRQAISAAADFFSHLGRTNYERPLQKLVQVEAHRLKYRDGEVVPVGKELLKGGRSMVPQYVYEAGHKGPHECYGLRITNRSSQRLYVWVFAFNMEDLSIGQSLCRWSRSMLIFSL
jgi:hypothetical protein